MCNKCLENPTTEDKAKRVLYAEWHSIIEEIDPIMDKIEVDHPRIERCTLKEEWRLGQGYNPFDGDLDNDCWKNSYDNVIDDCGAIGYYVKLLKKCDITKIVLEVKYPAIARRFADYLAAEGVKWE